MGDISKHFDRSEFACSCNCGFDTVDYELLNVLEDVRTHFNAQLKINSAARCLNHNRSIGSKDTSQHVQAKAADIAVKGIEPRGVQNYLIRKYQDKYGIGRYDTFSHIDVRSTKARWDKRS